MKKLLLLAVLAAFLNSCSKNPKLKGHWIHEKHKYVAYDNGEIISTQEVVDGSGDDHHFTASGSIIVGTAEVGTYTSSTIKYNGVVYTITTLTKDQIIAEQYPEGLEEGTALTQYFRK